jgi:hypothetical protein
LIDFFDCKEINPHGDQIRASVFYESNATKLSFVFSKSAAGRKNALSLSLFLCVKEGESERREREGES